MLNAMCRTLLTHTLGGAGARCALVRRTMRRLDDKTGKPLVVSTIVVSSTYQVYVHPAVDMQPVNKCYMSCYHGHCTAAYSHICRVPFSARL